MRACGMKCVAMVAGVLVSAGAVLTASGQAVDVTLISEVGQPAPGLGSEWDSFSVPRVNGSGQLLYRAGLADGRSGLFVSLDGETFESVVEIGQPQPDTPGLTFEALGDHAIDRDGAVTFSELTEFDSTGELKAYWHRLPGGPPVLLAREDDRVPDIPNEYYESFRDVRSVPLARRTIVSGRYRRGTQDSFFRIPLPDGSFLHRYREGLSVQGMFPWARWGSSVEGYNVFGNTAGDLVVSGLGVLDSGDEQTFVMIDPLDEPPMFPVLSGDMTSTGETMYRIGEARGVDTAGNVLFKAWLDADFSSRPALLYKQPGQLAEVLFRDFDPIPGTGLNYLDSNRWLLLDGLVGRPGSSITFDPATRQGSFFLEADRDPLTGEDSPGARAPFRGGHGGGSSPYAGLDQISVSGKGVFHFEVEGRMGLYLFDARTGVVGLALRENAMLEVAPGELREVRSWRYYDDQASSTLALDDSGAVYTLVFFADHPVGIYRFELVDPNATCPADVNGDGELGPGDFNAWVAAFNAGGDGCDQNGDGLCTPADFIAWVANFVAGC
ncbi:MAG: GC-type dockerin domain-anchored protein [Planctomycetota bacterium]